MAEIEIAQNKEEEIKQLVVTSTKEKKQVNCCALFLTFIQYSIYVLFALYCYVGCPILIYYGALGGIISDRLFESAIYITVIVYGGPIGFLFLKCFAENCRTRTISCGNTECLCC